MNDGYEKLPDSIVLSDSITDLPISLRDKVEIGDEFDILCSQRFTELAQLIEEHADIEDGYGGQANQKTGRSFRAFASNFTFAMNLEKIAEEQSAEWDNSGLSELISSPKTRREVYKNDIVPPNREKPNSRFSKLIPSYVNVKTLGDEYDADSPKVQPIINTRKANSERTKNTEEKQAVPRISTQQLLEDEKNVDLNQWTIIQAANTKPLDLLPDLKLQSSESLVVNEQYDYFPKQGCPDEQVDPKTYSVNELEPHSLYFPSNDLLSNSVSDVKNTSGNMTPQLYSKENIEPEKIDQCSHIDKTPIKDNLDANPSQAQSHQPNSPLFLHSLFKFRPKRNPKKDQLKAKAGSSKQNFSKKKRPVNEQIYLSNVPGNKLRNYCSVEIKPASLSRSPDAQKPPRIKVESKIAIPKSLSPPKYFMYRDLKLDNPYIQT